MSVNHRVRLLTILLTSLFLDVADVSSVHAVGQYLVGDRTLGRVLRYNEDGGFLGTLIYDPTLDTGLGTFDGGLTSLTLSPDQTRLYISDRLSNRIRVYSYGGNTASHLFDITAAGASPSTLALPAKVLFSQDASKIYVANLGPLGPGGLEGDKVAQLTPNGASAGPDLSGGPPRGRSGLAFKPDGTLLVSDLNIFGSGQGGVLQFDSGSNQFVPFIGPMPEFAGCGNLLVIGNDLYVAGVEGSYVGKFNATTGALITSFNGNGFIEPSFEHAGPASLAIGPGGNSILIGYAGVTTGSGHIEEFDFNGVSLGDWATNTHSTNYPPNGTGTVPDDNNIQGFSEATAIVFSTIVPEPTSATLCLAGLLALGMIRRRT